MDLAQKAYDARDYAEARRLYGLAAAQGHAEAQCCLGCMHCDGQGGQADFAEARRLLGLAAAQGHDFESRLHFWRDECGLPAAAHFQLQTLRIWRNASLHRDAGQWQRKGPPSAQAASEHLAALWSTVDRLCSASLAGA